MDRHSPSAAATLSVEQAKAQLRLAAQRLSLQRAVSEHPWESLLVAVTSGMTMGSHGAAAADMIGKLAREAIGMAGSECVEPGGAAQAHPEAPQEQRQAAA